jgi:hypothetical protein
MALKVWNGTAWTSASAIKVWNGTAWTSASSGKVWNGSAWVEFHGALAATLPDQNPGVYSINIASSGTDPTAAFARSFLVLDTDGTGRYYTVTSDAGTTELSSSPFTWKTGGGSVSDYYAYLDTPTGDALNPASAATGTSLQLSTQRIWYLNDIDTIGSNVPKQCNSTIRIKNVSGTDLVAKTIYFYALAQADGPPGG